MKQPEPKTLYERLGGYDAIAAVVDNLLPRLMHDPQLGRFWEHRGEDGLERERQLLINFLCHYAGGPVYYAGRDMKLAHKGMRISQSDWDIFMRHVRDTFAEFNLPPTEAAEVANLIESTHHDIVEVFLDS